LILFRVKHFDKSEHRDRRETNEMQGYSLETLLG
jgi:hypothetical protein